MGMFDTGFITCPHCGKVTDEQTKNFECCLQQFNLDEPISPYIVAGFAGEWTCMNCDKIFYIKDILPVKDVKAEVTTINPKLEKIDDKTLAKNKR